MKEETIKTLKLLGAGILLFIALEGFGFLAIIQINNFILLGMAIWLIWSSLKKKR